MEYFGRNSFVMNILQTITYRKPLNQSTLRAGDGGCPERSPTIGLQDVADLSPDVTSAGRLW